MSYNHEPQFNSQSATVQDISDYLSFKREWLLYIEGFSDRFPDTNDYEERCNVFGHMLLGSSRIDRMLRTDLLTHALSIMDISYPLQKQEIEMLGLLSLSMRFNTLLMHRYSCIRSDIPDVRFEDDILQEIFEELRNNSNYITCCDDCGEYVISDYITS